MTADLFSLPVLLALALPGLMVCMLLPMILELRKPLDAGPRQIMADMSGLVAVQGWQASLRDIEGFEKFDAMSVGSMGKLFAVLPSLEG
jgi:hypothetical protein